MTKCKSFDSASPASGALDLVVHLESSLHTPSALLAPYGLSAFPAFPFVASEAFAEGAEGEFEGDTYSHLRGGHASER